MFLFLNSIAHSGIPEAPADLSILNIMQKFLALSIGKSYLNKNLGIPQEKITEMKSRDIVSEDEQRNKYILDIIKNGSDSDDIKSFIMAYMEAHKDNAKGKERLRLTEENGAIATALEKLKNDSTIDSNHRPLKNIFFAHKIVNKYWQSGKRYYFSDNKESYFYNMLRRLANDDRHLASNINRFKKIIDFTNGNATSESDKDKDTRESEIDKDIRDCMADITKLYESPNYCAGIPDTFTEHMDYDSSRAEAYMAHLIKNNESADLSNYIKTATDVLPIEEKFLNAICLKKYDKCIEPFKEKTKSCTDKKRKNIAENLFHSVKCTKYHCNKVFHSTESSDEERVLYFDVLKEYEDYKHELGALEGILKELEYDIHVINSGNAATPSTTGISGFGDSNNVATSTAPIHTAPIHEDAVKPSAPPSDEVVPAPIHEDTVKPSAPPRDEVLPPPFENPNNSENTNLVPLNSQASNQTENTHDAPPPCYESLYPNASTNPAEAPQASDNLIPIMIIDGRPYVPMDDMDDFRRLMFNNAQHDP